MSLQVVDDQIIARLAQQASESSRKRSHLLLHAGHDDAVQRLLIVLQPGTYVRPHRHSEQWEILTLVRGRGRLFNYSAPGQVLARIEMSLQTPLVQIPVGEWHSFVALEAGTAVLEVKPGPFRANEFADWAPPEGDPRVTQFLAQLAA